MSDSEQPEMRDIDRAFYDFWHGSESTEWPAEHVYSYVDPGTARALFAEGWVRAEEREEQQKKGADENPNCV